MRMPVMDGHEASRRIKAMPDGKRTPIIALTASAFEEDREAIMATGCDGFVRVQFKEHKLLDNIKQLLVVRFRYKEQAAESRKDMPLDSQALAQFPKELRARLLEAAQQLDSEKVEQANIIRAGLRMSIFPSTRDGTLEMPALSLLAHYRHGSMSL